MFRSLNLKQLCPVLTAVLVCTAILVFAGGAMSCGNGDEDNPKEK